MNAATEFDAGPLNWVKSEIDLALERAGEALGTFSGEGGTAPFRFARTHAHQARGALAIVGLDGATVFMDALEGLLEAVEQERVPATGAPVELALRALDGIRGYLDDLVRGAADQPLRLLPLYRELLAARGETEISPADLFFPDLSLRPPERPAAPPVDPAALQQMLRVQRGRFQRGLLLWLRQADDPAGASEMRDAVRAIEAAAQPSARPFWWVAAGLLSALASGSLAAAPELRQLCSRIDLQIRRLIEGSGNVAERLLRDALYFVAQCDSDDPALCEIRETYRLQGLLPESGASAPAAVPEADGHRRLREAILAAEESWNRFCAGSAQSLPLFRDHAQGIQRIAGELGHTDYRRLAQAVANAAGWLVEKSSRHSEALAMEMATAILLLQDAQENFLRLGADFAHQVDIMVARLHAFLAGNPPDEGAELPALDEMSRQAREKLLVGQVAREIQSNLAQIEQVLDGFFRDPARRHELAALDRPLRQVAGALTVMGEDGAVAALHACGQDIERFAAADYVPDEADFERVAERLSALGFFIDALPHDGGGFESFERAANGRRPADSADSDDSAAPDASVEEELEQARQDTRSLLNALRETPDDEGLRADLKWSLETLRQDADLVADSALAQQAAAALQALAAGASPATDPAFAALRPQEAAPVAPAVALPPVAAEALDAELLSIFIEEAHEVLATIGGSLEQLRARPHDVEVLTGLRRAFHTLKGSGRMVGLRDLGELAWAIEQVLNLWLRQELELTQPVFDLACEGHRVFSSWVRHLEDREQPLPETAALLALAESLRTGDAHVAAPVPETAAVSSEGDGSLAPGETSETGTDAGSAGVEPDVEAAAETAAATDAGLDFGPGVGLDDDTFTVTAEAPPCDESGDIPAGEAAGPGADERADADAGDAPSLPAEAGDEAAAAGDLNDFDLGDFDLNDSAPDLAGIDDAVPAPAGNVVHADFGRHAPPSGDEPGQGDVSPLSGEAPATDPASFPPTLPDNVSELRPPPAATRGASLGISPALYDIFQEEARTHIATLHREFSELVADPSRPTPFAMLRAVHTLAGIAGTVGIAVIRTLGVALEHALLRRETTEHPADAEALERVRQAIVALESMADSVAAGHPPETDPDLLDTLDALYPPPAAESAEFPELPGITAETGDAAPALPSCAADASPTDEAPWPEEVQDYGPDAGTDRQPDGISDSDALAATDGGSGMASPGLPEVPDESGHIEHAGDTGDTGDEAPPLPADDFDEQLLPVFVEEAGELLTAIGEELRHWRALPGDDTAPQALGRLLHTLKGNARMAGAMRLGELVHGIEARLVQSRFADGATAESIDAVEAACDAVARIIEDIRHGGAGLAGEEAGAPVGALADDTLEAGAATDDDNRERKTLLRVRTELVDQWVNEAGELSIARSRIEAEMRGLKESLLDLTENVTRLRRQLREIEIEAESRMPSGAAADESREGFDPLEFDRFTRFQELTRMMAESVNDVATVQQNLLHGLDGAGAALTAQARVNRQLQQQLMSVRMVPFASLADRFHRVVRQTAKELGKRANLEIRGGRVEIDRSILDRIEPALEHLLRNAVAHGLEEGAVRLAAGKPEIGELTLSLSQEGNEAILTLADDGSGLDLERIRARGIATGLIADGEEVDTERLTRLIFAPGFSTADTVSQIAGRGIGMDVVQTEIGRLGGRIEVTSTAGQGACFHLHIPITLAVTQALIVRVGTQLHAIPSAMVEQAQELREDALARIRADGKVVWQGNDYPWHFLPHLLGEPAALPETQRRYWLLLLRSGVQRVAVQVDELCGNREIVAKSVGSQLARIVGIDGATVLGDGRIVLILNPVALASRPVSAAASALPAAAAQERAQPDVTATRAASLPTVMVVDDSLTVRKITGRLLAREGYQVLTAKDGVDALEQMLDIVPDVLLVDIEMPRMDGFDLTRNVRADEKLGNVPIVMITSRTADKHRQHAFSLGVNHYLGKPYDEGELLALVDEYTRAKRSR